jgi:hypothetical protein
MINGLNKKKDIFFIQLYSPYSIEFKIVHLLC